MLILSFVYNQVGSSPTMVNLSLIHPYNVISYLIHSAERLYLAGGGWLWRPRGNLLWPLPDEYLFLIDGTTAKYTVVLL